MSYRPIADYGLLADGHGMALVARDGSIDWCCVPRLDAGSSFGALLDDEKGGSFSIAAKNASVTREYLEDTVVLVTTFDAGGIEARLIDCLVARDGGRADEDRRLLRIVEGVRGEMELDVRFEPRFDYGAIAAWVRR
jgi:GH15 family glucan-1,4-alpha-glucosidase